MAGLKLRIEGTFLRSKVARRVFFLFVLSAFVPAALLTVLSYVQVRSMDSENARRQLAHEGSNFARGIYDRLLGAHFMLSVKTAGQRAGINVADSSAFDSGKVFRRVYLIVGETVSMREGASSDDPPPRIDEMVKSHLAKGESALLPLDGPLAGRPMLAKAIDPEHMTRGVLVAELNPLYLWGGDEEYSPQTQACVLDAVPKVLFCSDGKLSTLATSVVGRDTADKVANTEGWLYDTRGLFLRARFAANDWSVVTFRSDVVGEATLTRLTYTFLGIILLTLLLVALLSVVQIRRTLVPLEQLIEGTRRIAREEFDQPVTVERDDEFGQLAHALNRMATRLGQQMGTMRALSAIDQEILSHVDMAQIIARVQERLQVLWPDAVTGVVVFDQQAADFGIVHLDAGRDGVTAKIPTKLEPWLLGRLARDYDGAWFDVSGSDLPDFLSMMVESGAKRILVLPIFWRDKANGVLAIGLLEQREFDAELIAQARDLGNRIGVALAAQARDEQLKYRAFHDNLTGLPNRALLIQHLNQELAHARRHDKQLALIFVDLDRFKSINDSMGQDSGDRLLCQVAERLTSCTREGDTVARLGGDEFAVLLPGLGNTLHAARLASEMQSLLSEPFVIDGSECFIGASIGVSLFPNDGNLAQELLKKADMALYRAKATGRGRIIFFEESMNVAQLERATMERELRQAIARNQLVIHYQPRIALADGRLSGAEALLRWHHPAMGWVSPEQFIPLAVEVGLIDEIGLWVLRQVCEQLVKWQGAGVAIGVISVNVSGRQFKSGRLIQQVRHVLESTGAAPEALEVEVTEATLIDNDEEVIDQLNQLKQIGVTIALDDFGTGYSSLTHLQRLPFDILKIDQSFIQELGQDEGVKSIVYSIITLAHALHKSVVAEGVETGQQAHLLRSWGCEQAQGHYYSRPVSASELEEILSIPRTAAN